LKKLFAIALVIVVLFNSGGYDLFFQYLMYRSDSRIKEKINNNRYHNSDLVEVKIPVNMPTQQDWDGYEAVSGQVDIKGNRYDYAEIKITRDTLFLHVIPNTDLVKVVKAKGLYAKLVSELPASNSKHPVNSFTKKSICESEFLSFNYSHSNIITIETFSHQYISPNITSPVLEVGGQPPEA